MKNIAKTLEKILIFLTVIVMAFSVLPSAFAETAESGEKTTY